jgi:hypothetical protein
MRPGTQRGSSERTSPLSPPPSETDFLNDLLSPTGAAQVAKAQVHKEKGNAAFKAGALQRAIREWDKVRAATGLWTAGADRVQESALG